MVDIQLTSHSKESYNNLETGQADLVLATLPKKQQALLKQTEVWEDPLYFVTNQQHPLAQKKTITPSNLSQTPAIIPHKNTATGQVIHEYFMQQNLGIKQAPQVPSSANFILIKTLITLGLGWGLLPQHMLDSSFKNYR